MQNASRPAGEAGQSRAEHAHPRTQSDHAAVTLHMQRGEFPFWTTETNAMSTAEAPLPHPTPVEKGRISPICETRRDLHYRLSEVQDLA